MRKLYPVLLLAALLAGCFMDSPSVGGSTETETGTASLSGKVIWPDGSPAIGVRTRLRRTDFQLGGIPKIVPTGRIQADAVTDDQGRYLFTRIRVGEEYQVEAVFSEGFGAVARFTLPLEAVRMQLEDLVMRNTLTVTGRVRFSDSSLAPAIVHVLGTEHTAEADSATGLFQLRDMPPGVFDLRLSTPMPFFPAKDFPGKVVENPGPLDLGDLVLDKGSKQEFSLTGGKVTLAGIDGSNPVLYDNDFGNNTWDNEVLWALASAGRIDLRGNLITAVTRDSLVMDTADYFPGWMEEVRRCRLAGMRNIPDPIIAATRRLILPASGRWQDIVPPTNPGVMLLLSEARKASAEEPLVVLAEGALTTIAQAVLLDPYVADRMVVFGAYNHGLNGKDSLASYIVARKCRFVEWGRDYLWSGPGPSSSPLPPNRVGLDLAASRDTTAQPLLFFADYSALPFLMDNQAWTTARGAQVLAPPLNVNLEGFGPYDIIDIPIQANEWGLMDKMLFAALADPGAYHPWPVPGAIAAVSFKAMSGTRIDSVAGEGEILVDIGQGDWMEYALDLPSDGSYDLVLRQRVTAAAVVRISGPAGSLASLDLAAGSGWREARTRLTLGKGVQTVRLSTASGTWQLGRLQWEKAP